MTTYSTPHSPLSPVMHRTETCAPTAPDFPTCTAGAATAAVIRWTDVGDAAELADAAACATPHMMPRYASDTPLLEHTNANGSFSHRGAAWHSGGVSPSMTPGSQPRTAGASPDGAAMLPWSARHVVSHVAGQALPPPLQQRRRGAAAAGAGHAAMEESDLIGFVTPVDDFAATHDVESPHRLTTNASRNTARGTPGGAALKHRSGGGHVSGCRVRVPKSAGGASSETGFASLVEALPAGVERGEYFMRLTDDGAGGTYFVYSVRDPDAPVAVFKPAAEEVGAPENPRGNDSEAAIDDRFADGGFVPGQGYLREVVAYDLDAGRLAGVPQTAIVTIPGKGAGSLQRFCPRMIQSWSTTPAKFDVASVQAIAVFDVRVLNCDRHGGNLLVPKDAPGFAMVPIDHGFILPEQWSDPDFEWAMWPQANAAIGPAIRAAVAAIDTDADVAKVEAALGPGPAEVIAVTTRLVKAALAPGKAYTLKDLANFCRRPSLTEPAGLERLMASCRRDLDAGGDIDTDAVERALALAFP